MAKPGIKRQSAKQNGNINLGPCIMYHPLLHLKVYEKNVICYNSG